MRKPLQFKVVAAAALAACLVAADAGAAVIYATGDRDAFLATMAGQQLAVSSDTYAAGGGFVPSTTSFAGHPSRDQRHRRRRPHARPGHHFDGV